MAGFVGRYEHSLDTKGRVILPAKFRGQFERGGYLTQNSEGCLALWTPGEFERRMEAMQEKADAGSRRPEPGPDLGVELRRGRNRPAGADADSRHLRTFARLDAEVLVHGAIDRVELWNPDGLGRAGAARGELAARTTRTSARHRRRSTARPDNERQEEQQEERNEQTAGPRTRQDTQDTQERTGPCAAPRPARWKATPPTSTLVVRISTSLSTHRPRGCRWPTRSNTFPCCATKWSRCSHPCPPGWSSTRPSEGAGMPRRCWRRTQACASSGWTAIPPRSRRPGSGCPSFGDRVTLRGRSVLLAGVGSLAGPGLGPLAGVLFDLGRQLPAARLVRAGVLVPRGRPARHADGPDHRAHGRRPGQHPSRGGPGGACSARTERAACPGASPGPSWSPATDLHEAAGRSRGVGRAGAGPPEGSPGPAGVPGAAHPGERRAGPARGRPPGGPRRTWRSAACAR